MSIEEDWMDSEKMCQKKINGMAISKEVVVGVVEWVREGGEKCTLFFR
jgi:hypothetical protein